MRGEVKKSTLKNGIRIISRRIPLFHSVSMGVWVNAGARDESESQNGLSHLIEHMIFKGTKKRSAYQIAKEFDAIGGQTNAFTAMENTCYHARVLDTHLVTMVEILSDIFLNSVFDSIELERERLVILQEIGMMEDSPDDLIHVLSSRAFWGDHPLGRNILGTRENVAAFDSNRIENFFHSFYQPERIVITVAGNLHHEHFVDLVGPAFETIQKGNGFPLRKQPLPRNGVSFHSKNLEQTHICLGTRGLSTADPMRYAFSLMNTILGGNMSSRLFQEVRERQGLAYSVYSFTSTYEDSGMFGIYAGVDPKNTHETIALILKELQRIKEQLVDDDNFQHAKEFIKGNLMMAAESVDNQMVRLAQNEIHLNGFIPVEVLVDEIEKVTTNQVRDLARELFTEDALSLTVLGTMTSEADLQNLLYF
jgi:predicted Zn-dependent peptidase